MTKVKVIERGKVVKTFKSKAAKRRYEAYKHMHIKKGRRKS